jgi:hypothetical protein
VLNPSDTRFFCSRASAALLVLPAASSLSRSNSAKEEDLSPSHSLDQGDVRELKAHSKARTPLPEIAKKMKRTEKALRRKAGILGIGLGHNR